MGITLTDVLLFGKAQLADVDKATLVIYRRNILRWSALGGYLDIIVKGVSPLSLPDAIANSLSYVKAFGGTEQRNLPDGYTQLEYIESTGTQYIDTSVYISTGYKVRVKAYATSIPTSMAFFGCTTTADASNARKGIYRIIGGTINRCAWGDGSGSVIGNLSGNDSLNTWYDMVCDNGVWTINDTLFATCPESSFTSEYSMWLFARNTGGTVGLPASCRISVCQIWDNNGQMIRNLVPAKNASNVVGMYDTVSQTFFTNAGTGDFVAGPEVVPTPNTPMDIVSNNGVLKARQNLWKGNYTDLGYLGLNGVVVPTASYMASDFIEIDQSKKYTFYEQILSTYTGNGMRICFYNSNKQMVGQRQGDAAIDIGSYAYIATPPANAKYIRVSTGVNTGYVTDITLVEGEYNTTTIQGVVGSIYADGTVETINVHNKNLFDEQWNRNTGVSTQTATWGQVVTASGWSTSGLVPVKAGQQYTVSYNTPCQIYVFYYESDGTMQSSYDTATATKKTFTVPAGATHIRLQVNKNTEAQIADLKAQLETGATATDYEPYYNGGTATAEMLLKVDTYQDVQSIIDGVVTRNIGVKVLDGTENWFVVTGYSNLYGLAVADGVFESNKLPMSTHYQGTTANNASMSNNTVKATTATVLAPNKVSVYIKDGVNDTLENFKQFLANQYAAGTPVIVIYPLATPTTESVTGQTLQVQEGNNILEITQASLSNLELEAQYQAAVSLTIQEVQDANLDPNVQVTIN